MSLTTLLTGLMPTPAAGAALIAKLILGFARARASRNLTDLDDEVKELVHDLEPGTLPPKPEGMSYTDFCQALIAEGRASAHRLLDMMADPPAPPVKG